MEKIVQEVVRGLVAKVREEGLEAKYLEVVADSKDINDLDAVFDDGGEFRSEHVVDPLAEEQMDAGVSLDKIESGYNWKYYEKVMQQATKELKG